MDFCYALNALKEGKKVCRSGWNGKGMWLILVDGYNTELPKDVTQYVMSAFVAMKTVDDKLVPWLCSQTDLLAEDWMVTE